MSKTASRSCPLPYIDVPAEFFPGHTCHCHVGQIEALFFAYSWVMQSLRSKREAIPCEEPPRRVTNFNASWRRTVSYPRPPRVTHHGEAYGRRYSPIFRARLNVRRRQPIFPVTQPHASSAEVAVTPVSDEINA